MRSCSMVLLLVSCATGRAPDATSVPPSAGPVAPTAPAPAPPCLRAIPFLEDHSRPAKAGLPILDANARCIREHGVSVVLTGHPDDTVPPERVAEVGLAMADAVRSELLRLGVPAERMETRAAAEAPPACPQPAEGCREQVRRVEVSPR